MDIHIKQAVKALEILVKTTCPEDVAVILQYGDTVKVFSDDLALKSSVTVKLYKTLEHYGDDGAEHLYKAMCLYYPDLIDTVIVNTFDKFKIFVIGPESDCKGDLIKYTKLVQLYVEAYLNKSI
nr:MAG TPA: hypothetical protein [Caudoviricetes sp.]